MLKPIDLDSHSALCSKIQRPDNSANFQPVVETSQPLNRICPESTNNRHNPHLQVPGPEVEDDVQQVDEVHQVVEGEPDDDRLPRDLGEGEAEDDHPEVVEEGQGNDHRPVVA